MSVNPTAIPPSALGTVPAQPSSQTGIPQTKEEQDQKIAQLGGQLQALANQLMPTAVQNPIKNKLNPGQQALQYSLSNGLQLSATRSKQGQKIKKQHKKPDDSGYFAALGYDA